jgi:predicted methyltransferase
MVGKLSRRAFGTFGVAALIDGLGAARCAAADPSDAPMPGLAAAIGGPARRAFNVARDRYRHPAAVLRFFGVRADQAVLEIEPGAGYWTEILAPFLKADGRYIAALPVPANAGWRTFIERLERDPSAFGRVEITGMGAGPMVAPGSVDVVLSFRNLHDWMADGTASAKLAAMYAALKPGGVLGMEDHRAAPDRPQDPKARDGYVREDYAKALIKQAGFRFVAASAVGDNPRDTKNYPDGVWTLPPTLRLGAVDRAKYLAIGESDRWTMKFVKPEAA